MPKVPSALLRLPMLGLVVVSVVGVASAAPLGAITEFSSGLNPGSIPDGMAAGSDGNLWFADRSATPAVGRITPSGTVTEFTSGLNPGSVPGGSLQTGTVAVGGIAAGPDGNVWFTDHGTTSAIGRIAPSGTITEFSSGLPVGSVPYKISAGPDGNVWFTDRDTTSVASVTTIAGTPGTATVGVGTFPAGLVAGTPVSGTGIPSGATVVSGAGTSTLQLSKVTTAEASETLTFSTPAIGQITPSGTITEFSSGLPGGSKPGGIVAGPDGNLWFAEQGTKVAIGMFNPNSDAITEFSTGLNSGSIPNAITRGPDGNIWFSDRGTTPAIGFINPTTHAIMEFSTGLPTGSSPDGITTGADGNIWFADHAGGGAIGMINPTTDAITEYKTGLNTGSIPTKIAVGSDGNLWFADTGTTRAIGQVGVGAPAASVTPPSITGSGGVGTPQTCGGDVWSSWAGQQPSHSAYGFDGYQWLLDGSPITGATGPSYTPTVADEGHMLSCEATVTYTLFPTTVSATSAAVLVKGAAEQLTDLGTAVAGVGPGQSLASKVTAIQGYVTTNDTADACSTLGAFINEVNAQTGKKIGTTDAASFVTQAHDIEAALGC